MGFLSRTLFLTVASVVLVLYPYVYAGSYAAEGKWIDLKERQFVVLICSESNLGGAFAGPTLAIPTDGTVTSTTVGCATDQPADFHRDWNSVTNGAIVVRCLSGDNAWSHYPVAMERDSTWVVTCSSS